ncbi:hypothetical protein DFP72DRAFT_1070192 [Ephemerocybe angulata]|uniref:Uncharacterized protein n=1 Tax=Ephemerocybe angulata TaxID=980116 RepID=A0A8H6HUL7_9AGAR|nr:hypothetical protein DFP72DRAFT_1070192 [Tulosesus angulatus]
MVELRFSGKPHPSADVLRATLQLAAANERRIAIRLVLVSRAVKEWIEPILYHTVTLSRATSTIAFWRTIAFSQKLPSFFAEHVKVMCISEEAHTAYLTQILLTCSGVTSLTFWTIPASSWQNNLVAGDFNSDLTSSHPGPRLWLSQPQPGAGYNQVQHDSFPDDCFDAVRPKRLVACFRDPSSLAFTPDLSRLVFTFVTHLSILNSWEEWIFWDIGNHLPSLSYIALDLNVARNKPTAIGADSMGRGGSGDQLNVNLQLARTLKNVLHRCHHLRVCVLVLLFDNNPHSTLARISESILHLEHEDSKRFPFNNPPSVLDPRMVFLQSLSPFSVRQAHAWTEERMWREAERRAIGQEKLNTGQ